MQALSQWTPPGGTLGTITVAAVLRADRLEKRRFVLERLAASSAPGPSLARALRADAVTLLAEIKRRSPSKGAIASGLDAVAQARAYVEGGARGVSVLTEPDHFGGAPADLIDVVAALPSVPFLRKDFHVAPIQLLEARALGASAVLLIARALSPASLTEMATEARSLGLEVLVEVRDEAELERAIATGASMVGVNNRNLETLEIDPATCDRLIPRIPAGVVAIAESGVRSRADVERYGQCGADAVLVGSVLSAASDVVEATRALTGVARVGR